MKSEKAPPVTAEAAVHLLDQIRELMQLQGDNPFKIRAFEKAAHAIAGQTDLAERVKAKTLTEIPGIGKGISEVLIEYFTTGKSTALNDLQKDLPEGLLDLVQIPGLGPKKARVIIDELGVHSVRELEYACKENRLLKLMGFGEKAQAKILAAIELMNKNEGFRRLGDVYFESLQAQEKIEKELGTRVALVGEVARKLEVISQISFLVEGAEKDRSKIESKIKKLSPEPKMTHVHFSDLKNFGTESVRLSSSEEHWKALGSPSKVHARDEKSFYQELGLVEIAPEFRETGEEVKLAKKNELNKILQFDQIEGVFHNHTNRSDGVASLEEMVLGAKKRGYKYIGISDHSQSSFYANGLKSEQLKEQEKEVRALQEKHPEIRIFWGIECDILQEGALDYADSTLNKFDFVVASVHQRFKLDKKVMTERIIKAIRHPAVTMLGHLTGRLLLDRPGYEIDIEKIIKVATEHDVAIELNANPQRLDIDWRWGHELRARGTKISVNPDAHSVEGLDHTFYGIAMARKALIQAKNVVNAWKLSEVEKWLK